MGLFQRYPSLRRVVVNTKTGRAFRGVLWRRRWGYVLLRDAEMVKPGGETVRMDGEVMVDAANVDFIQVL